MATAVVFGEITDDETHETTQSYQVAPDSPGAKVLSAYSLTQAPCGQGDQVVIHGPNNSVVCAAPNNSVSAGHYNLDVANLTLTTQQAAAQPASQPQTQKPSAQPTSPPK